ncbi:flagellar basal body-associated FliL family protein [Actinoplanes friuliensis]|jgi:flagellar protein FliL|uniref:Flagellar protein FliL n=1 Tax=Actinoplanes friuliensis DSM 7358 TaxID=1246995 RepID=U5WAV4_9ACTN|nr:flagellar basal body-associated FliL family protein [Actinoplanes friuliensis]AGZ46353.1 putative flagellar basal body-associated protein [Actinoplanes friuliensis DSM 7358]
MSKEETKDATAEAPKKSKKMLMIIVLAVVLLGGGGAGAWFFFLKGDAAEAKEPEPVKGAVVAIEETMTINLADAHYLKLGFALQMTEEAGEEEIDTSEAIDLAIDQYTGAKIGELETLKGREASKAELLEKIEKAYNVEDKHLVMGIYFTSFVTQ